MEKVTAQLQEMATDWSWARDWRWLWALPAAPVVLFCYRWARFWGRYVRTAWPYRGVWRHPRRCPAIIDVVDNNGEFEKVVEDFKLPDGSYRKLSNWGPYIDGSVILVTSDKDTIQEFLSAKNEEVPKNPIFYDVISLLIGKGLVTSEGEGWRKQRKLLTPYFHFKSIQEAFPTMLESMDHFIQYIQSKDIWLPAKETFVRHTSRVIFKVGFGDAFEYDWINKKIKTINETFNNHYLGLLFFGPIWNYVPIKIGSGFGKERKDLFDKVKEVIRMKRSKVPTEEEIDSNLLNFLCYSRNEDGELNPENQVVDECVTFIFAGEDTTASTLSWIMYHLALHPHIQKIMQEEIDRVLQGNLPNFTNLHSLHYCQNVIKETMRISPVVPILPRMLGKDYIIDGHVVKKGTLIHLFLYGVHVDPKIWKDPKEFNPERWEDSAKSFHWLPFSAGQRNCIGQKFAMQELLIAIAMIFQKFSVVYNTEKKIVAVFEGVLIPKNLEIKFIPRLQEEKE